MNSTQPWDRRVWIAAVQARVDLPSGAKLTGLCLADMASDDGRCRATGERLQAVTMAARATVNKHKRQLTDARLLRQTAVPAPGRPAEYTLTMPAPDTCMACGVLLPGPHRAVNGRRCPYEDGRPAGDQR